MAQYLYGSAESQVVAREILDENMFKQYEEEAMFFNMFADGSDKFVGDVGAQWVNVVQGNPGMKGMSSSDRAFHRGSTSKRVRSKVTFAQFAITRAFTGQVLHTDMKSLIKGWAPMIKEDMSTFIKQLNIMFAAGDGSGKLATVTAAPAGTATITFDQPVGATQLLSRGQYQIVDPADGTAHSLTINAVPVTTPYLIGKTGANIGLFADDEEDAVVDNITATTVAAGDIAIWNGTYNNVPKGLWYHLATGSRTYQNVNTATYPQFNPPMYDAGNGPLTVLLMDKLEAGLVYRAGKDDVLDGMFWVMAPTQVNAYRKLGYNTPEVGVVKRFGAGDRVLDLGFPVIRHNGRVIYQDVDADQTRAALITKSTFQRLAAKAPSVVNDTGELLNKVYNSAGQRLWQYTFDINTLLELGNTEISRNGGIINLAWQGLPIKGDVQGF
jgi:hypothetical protein